MVCEEGSPNIVRVIKSRRLRWGGHVARMEEGAFTILRSIRLGRPKHRWVEIVRMVLNQIGINAR